MPPFDGNRVEIAGIGEYDLVAVDGGKTEQAGFGRLGLSCSGGDSQEDDKQGGGVSIHFATFGCMC